MSYGTVLGASTTVAGIAALPNTGGSRSVVTYVAMLSIVAGVVVLLSTAARFVAKHHFNA